MAKRYTVEFNAKVTPVKPLNDEFTLCKCYVMALNKNRNLSFISKDAADAALPTLFNIPVIGHLYVDDEGKYHMGGHDMTIVQNADGQFEFKSICVPYGVVPQQDNIHYEDIQEPNGDIHTYIVSDVILWTGRFPELHEAVYSEETYFGQSMEINVNDYAPLEEDKNYTNILSYTYSALCLLGKSDNPDEHTEPCFPMSRVDPYEFSLDDDKFSELMSQLKNELAFCFDSNAEKKGEGMEEAKNTMSEQTETTEVPVENFEGNTENAVIPEAEVPAMEPQTEAPAEPEGSFENDNEGEPTADPVSEPKVFNATYKEKREALHNALPEKSEVDEEGNVVHSVYYWVCDFDDTNVYVERNEWKKDEGYNDTKGKFAYTFNEANLSATITGEFVEMYVKWLTKEEVAQVDAMRNQYEELIQYKESREKTDREAAFDEAIAEFAYLADIDEYKTVYANRYSYESIQALQDACYIVKGKYSVPTPQRKPATDPVVPVGDNLAPATLHERFHERFGKR